MPFHTDVAVVEDTRQVKSGPGPIISQMAVVERWLLERFHKTIATQRSTSSVFNRFMADMVI